MMDANQARERFISLYKEKITREHSEELLTYLTSRGSDFFTAPASTRHHYAFEGGLCMHSLNVYDCLCDFLARPRLKEVYGFPDFSDESLAVVALLHDVCKINTYKVSSRNTKDANGKWIAVPFYEYDDQLPYGHGEKSVYILTGFLRLTRDEAFAIRYHMGFSGGEDKNSIGRSLERYPLAYALSAADMEATYYLEGEAANGEA